MRPREGCGKRDAVRAPPRPSLVSRPGVLTALLLCGCGAFNAAGSNGVGSSPGATAGSARVERREVDHHPPINLVVRLGDPLPAVAFASAHDRGAAASVALSALILARLQAHGINDVVSVPTENGLQLAVLCADTAAASAFIGQITAALGTPLGEHDDALPMIAQHLTALRSRSFAGRADAVVAECSGDLGQACRSRDARRADGSGACGAREISRVRVRGAFERLLGVGLERVSSTARGGCSGQSCRSGPWRRGRRRLAKRRRHRRRRHGWRQTPLRGTAPCRRGSRVVLGARVDVERQRAQLAPTQLPTGVQFGARGVSSATAARGARWLARRSGLAGGRSARRR